jgi:inner membrane protein
MMAMSHVLTSLAAWSVAAQYTSLEPTAGGMLAVIAGALLPDIDHPKSWLGRRLWFISAPLSLLIGHRGMTHSLLAVIALGAALTLYGPLGGYLIASVCIGYLTHMAGDFVTKGGIPVFWPLKRRFALPIMVTGSIVEFLSVAALMVALAYHQADYWTEQAGTLLNRGFI